MKIQASILAALTAQNQVEASFWNPFSLFKPSKPAQSQFEPMPAQTASVQQTVLCQDDFLRCSSWKHACDVKSIQKICAKTCGTCGGSAPAPVAQVSEPAAAPVKQSYPAPVQVEKQAPEPVQAPVYSPFVDPVAQVLGNRPSYQPTSSGFSSNFYPRPVQQFQAPAVYQPIYQVPIYQAPVQQQTSCGDQFSGCSAWKSVCGNASIQKLCPGTCGLCGNQSQYYIAPIAPVAPKPVYWSAQRPVVEAAPVVQQPVYKPVAPVAPVASSCSDKYTNCEAYRDQCSNRIILNVCAKSCGACVEAVTMPTMAPTMPPTMAPTTTTTTTTTEEPESSGDNQEEDAPAAAASEFTPPVLIEETTTAPIAATTTTTEPMTTTTTIEEIVEVTTEYPSGEGPVPIPAEEFDNCKDFINNCAEFNGSQFRICDVTPEESLFQTYKTIQESCRKTCGLCDTNASCASLVDYCDEPNVAETCPGTCRGLEPMIF